MLQAAPPLRQARTDDSALELSETYRSFVDLCLGTQVSRALLKAGDNEPEGHRQLREVLSAVVRTVAIRPDFKLALGRQHAACRSGLSGGAAGAACDRVQRLGLRHRTRSGGMARGAGGVRTDGVVTGD